jgi:hypothetical protein
MIQTNITLGRPHRDRRNTKGCPDCLTSPTQLSYNLFVRQGGQSLRTCEHSLFFKGWVSYAVGPGMDADFMAAHILLNEHARSFNNTGADNKKCCADILFL